MKREEVMSDPTAKMLNSARGANVDLVPANQSLSALDVTLNDVLTDRVRAGQAIYVSGPLDEIQAKLHVADINRLMVDTCMPVTVIYSTF